MLFYVKSVKSLITKIDKNNQNGMKTRENKKNVCC